MMMFRVLFDTLLFDTFIVPSYTALYPHYSLILCCYNRFSLGLRMLLEQQKEQTGDGKLPSDLHELQVRLEAYQDSLTHWGLKDYQVTHLDQLSFSKMLYNFMHGCFIIVLASIPSLILNAPVGFAASYWAVRHPLNITHTLSYYSTHIFPSQCTFCFLLHPLTHSNTNLTHFTTHLITHLITHPTAYPTLIPGKTSTKRFESLSCQSGSP